MKKTEECKCPHTKLRRALRNKGYDTRATGDLLGKGAYYLRQRMQGHQPFDTDDMEILLKALGESWDSVLEYFPPYSEVRTRV